MIRDDASRIERCLTSGLFAGIDQPATGAGDAIGKNKNHRFTHGDANQDAAQNIVKRNIREERHIERSNTVVSLLCQAIGAEP
jgi:hypothetical protein